MSSSVPAQASPTPRLPGAAAQRAGAPRLDAGAAAGEAGTWVRVGGGWTALGFSSARDWRALSEMLAAHPPSDALGWDLREMAQFDHIGAQVLWNHWQHRWPAHVALDTSQQAVLDQVAQFSVPVAPAPGPTLLDHLRHFAGQGQHLVDTSRRFTQLIGQFVLDVGRLLAAPHRGPWRDLSGALYNTGATAMPITALVGLLIGVVLAYLTSQQLRQYGAESFIVNILGLSLVRELGPVLAAVLVAGRSGSAITAQIGVMRVTEELDAMRVMGIPHGFRLVMPRVLALAVAMPLISIWTSAAALVGGMMAAQLALDISPSYFLQALPRAVPISNVILALSKSAVFGILIALIACYHGMRVLPNTESLGQRTTSSVVISITVVILVDALFAVLFKGVGFR